jgi:hypothetical protein
MSKGFLFLFIYLISILLIVPSLSKLFGREPLPISSSGNLRPLTSLTYLLNRHYVKSELKIIVLSVADNMANDDRGSSVQYLDANFPFFDSFPLNPHLSHNDSKKLDLAFYYIDKRTGKKTNTCPSPIGYGICEEPGAGETSTSAYCEKRGYWQYSFLQKVVPQRGKEYYLFDESRTRKLLNLLTAQPGLEKLFIEPHLKERMGLKSNKIRFHGCQAVRHDDHIHVQLQ